MFANKDGTPCEVNYYRNPDASARKTRAGLLWMGDIGYKDEKGYFYFLHRDGGSIRRNGEFISATEIEKRLMDHPAVRDVFVFGVKSENGVAGEQDIVAALELSSACNCDLQALYRHCAEGLEKSHIPTYVQVMQQIPKTSAEKPLISLLQSSFDSALENVHRFSGSH